jgi:hypothetical protein
LSAPAVRALLFEQVDRWLRATPGLGVDERASEREGA